MHEELIRLIPEFDLFTDEELKKKTLLAYANALAEAGWEPDVMESMPFTLIIDPAPATMLEHVRGVVNVSLAIAEALKKAHPDNPKMHARHDVLLAGALLHDVGKFLEYELRDGKYMKSRSGELLRHPISGTGIAKAAGLPDEILHMIAYHSHEGDKARATLEAIIVNHADFLNFEPLKL